MKLIIIALLAAMVCAAAGQTRSERTPSADLAVWQPPTLEFPDTFPPATVPKEMITTLRVANVDVELEQTALRDAEKRLGATAGQHGDASEWVAWLCFYGTDMNGAWALWLESNELGGGIINGFALQRLGGQATPDARCRRLAEPPITMPVALRLDLTEVQVRKILGKSTLRYRDTLIFDHEHEENIRGERFTASNTVAVTLRNGVVSAIQVWKSTTN